MIAGEIEYIYLQEEEYDHFLDGLKNKLFAGKPQDGTGTPEVPPKKKPKGGFLRGLKNEVKEMGGLQGLGSAIKDVGGLFKRSDNPGEPSDFQVGVGAEGQGADPSVAGDQPEADSSNTYLWYGVTAVCALALVIGTVAYVRSTRAPKPVMTTA